MFLFSDMMLLCKNLTKKQHNSTEAKVKVIRQPFVIDRLIAMDITKDSMGSGGGLALAYLNEYAIVSAAFTFHSSESKVIRVSFKGHEGQNKGHSNKTLFFLMIGMEGAD